MQEFVRLVTLHYSGGMTAEVLSPALRHFAQVDAEMYQICSLAFKADHPPVLPTPKAVDEYFTTLVNSICSQQISVKAAASIYARLKNTIDLTPAAITAAGEGAVQECGVTKQKARYIVALARDWSGLATDEFEALTDAEIIARLSACYGIGRWTAEMFLMFAMARPDVFSVGDLGLRQRVAQHYDVPIKDHDSIKAIALRWSPYRTIASLALWHEIDNGPVLL